MLLVFSYFHFILNCQWSGMSIVGSRVCIRNDAKIIRDSVSEGKLYYNAFPNVNRPLLKSTAQHIKCLHVDICTFRSEKNMTTSYPNYRKKTCKWCLQLKFSNTQSLSNGQIVQLMTVFETWSIVD